MNWIFFFALISPLAVMLAVYALGVAQELRHNADRQL